MTPLDRETAILDRIRNELVGEGYEVVIRPNSLLLPPFLGGYRPDAVAFRDDKNLIVEVATQSPSAERRLQDLQQRLLDQPAWELMLVWSAPGDKGRSLQTSNYNAVAETLSEVRELNSTKKYKPALLLGWAALEALGRILLPGVLARPQSPARLIEQLAQSGRFSPDDADRARALISKRNRLVHGELNADIRKQDIEVLIRLLQTLLSEWELSKQEK